jgi:hypothetical protein
VKQPIRIYVDSDIVDVEPGEWFVHMTGPDEFRVCLRMHDDKRSVLVIPGPHGGSAFVDQEEALSWARIKRTEYEVEFCALKKRLGL